MKTTPCYCGADLAQCIEQAPTYHTANSGRPAALRRMSSSLSCALYFVSIE